MYQATFLKLSYWHLLPHILYHKYLFGDCYHIFKEGNTSRTFSRSPGHLSGGLGVELMTLTSCIFQGFILTISASTLCAFSSHDPFTTFVLGIPVNAFSPAVRVHWLQVPRCWRGLQESLWGEAGAVPCQTQPVPASSSAHNSWA